MKALVCEMCGSNDIVKKDGLFVCQFCGVKYLPEEAKKLMADEMNISDKISNYYALAQNAYDAGNKQEAETYCNKIIEIDPEYYKAWFLKGSAAGWQSTLQKPRLSECVAAYIISRINGFTHVETEYNQYTGELTIVKTTAFSDGDRAKVLCYGADDVNEGVAIMRHENVDVSITGNSTNPTRFQHPVAGTYKKWCVENGKKYFSVASGGGTGRTLHPDNMAAGPASYGMTDTMGRMHSDAQFAGSSSVPAHVEMMGFLGMGNNPMVGATVAVAVAVEEALKK